MADRQNCRIQIFSPQGEFISQWADAWWPCDMCIDAEGNMYVAEVGGIFMGAGEAGEPEVDTTTEVSDVPHDVPAPDLDKPSARVTIRDLTGTILVE